MTDIELIKLAAKAAGIPGCVIEGAVEFNFWLTKPDRFGRTWAPLIDDGDALRLAVKLKITPHIDDNLTDCESCTESHFNDPYAATRRAIVRAAAEIGKAMP